MNIFEDFEIDLIYEYLKDPSTLGSSAGLFVLVFYVLTRLFMPLIIANVSQDKKKRADSNFITGAEVEEKLKIQFNNCSILNEKNFNLFLELFEKHQLKIGSLIDKATAEFQIAVVDIQGNMGIGEQKFKYIEVHVEESKKLMETILQNMQNGKRCEKNNN